MTAMGWPPGLPPRARRRYNLDSWQALATRTQSRSRDGPENGTARAVHVGAPVPVTTMVRRGEKGNGGVWQ